MWVELLTEDVLESSGYIRPNLHGMPCEVLIIVLGYLGESDVLVMAVDDTIYCAAQPFRSYLFAKFCLFVSCCCQDAQIILLSYPAPDVRIVYLRNRGGNFDIDMQHAQRTMKSTSIMCLQVQH